MELTHGLAHVLRKVCFTISCDDKHSAALFKVLHKKLLGQLKKGDQLNVAHVGL